MGWFETSLKEQIIHQIKNSWRSPHPYTNSGIEVILATHVLIQWLQTMAAMAWWLVTMVIPFPKASQSPKLSTTTTYIQTGCSGFISVLYTRYNDVPLCPFPDNPPNIDDFSIEASIYVEFPVFDYWKNILVEIPNPCNQGFWGALCSATVGGPEYSNWNYAQASPRNHHVQWILTVNGDAHRFKHHLPCILHYGSKCFLIRYLTHLKFQIIPQVL